MLRRHLLASLLLASVTWSAGLGPEWYKCDPAKCLPAKNCQCPTSAPPGGLSPKDTPQFILFTHDDAVDGLSNKVMRMVTDGHRQKNGCNLPATWFVLEAGSNCTLAKQLWADNHEIATHTRSHLQMRPELAEDKNKGVSFEDEIVGARDWLVKECGIPQEDVVGFRAPYLIHNSYIREVLHEAGFLYDSSINEVFPSATSPNKSARLWPYTMDHGIPQDCSWTAPDGNCSTKERYPGLWQVPLWDLQGAKGESLSTMDPTGDVYSQLIQNFQFNYEGNRAPLGIFVHAPWLDTEHTAALNRFFEWALAQPDVWFVTMRQLLEWMKAPVPASQMADWYKCKPTNLKVPATTYCQVYTIQSGDYLYLIATNFGVSTTELLHLNPDLGDGMQLKVGTRIKIPPWNDACPKLTPSPINPGGSGGSGGSGSGKPSGSNSPAPGNSPPHMALPFPFLSPSPVPVLPTCRKWRVEEGDFLYAIATSTSTDMYEIADLNEIDIFDSLMPGQVLLIPPYPPCCNTTQGCPQPSSSPRMNLPGPAFNFSSGLNATFVMTGVTRTAWETDLQAIFRIALAQLLGVESGAVMITDVTQLGPASVLPFALPAAPAGANASTNGSASALADKAAADKAGAKQNANDNANSSSISANATSSVIMPLPGTDGSTGGGSGGFGSNGNTGSSGGGGFWNQAQLGGNYTYYGGNGNDGSSGWNGGGYNSGNNYASDDWNSNNYDGSSWNNFGGYDEGSNWTSGGGNENNGALVVLVLIPSNTPMTLYMAAMAALNANKFDLGLGALGMTLMQDPTFIPFQDGTALVTRPGPLPSPSPLALPFPALPSPSPKFNVVLGGSNATAVGAAAAANASTWDETDTEKDGGQVSASAVAPATESGAIITITAAPADSTGMLAGGAGSEAASDEPKKSSKFPIWTVVGVAGGVACAAVAAAVAGVALKRRYAARRAASAAAPAEAEVDGSVTAAHIQVASGLESEEAKQGHSSPEAGTLAIVVSGSSTPTLPSHRTSSTEEQA